MTPRDDERAGAVHCFARFVPTRGSQALQRWGPVLELEDWMSGVELQNSDRVCLRYRSDQLGTACARGCKRWQKCVPSLASATCRRKPPYGPDRRTPRAMLAHPGNTVEQTCYVDPVLGRHIACLLLEINQFIMCMSVAFRKPAESPGD